MQEYIKELLKTSKADAWEIKNTTTEGWEFYFIRHKLDQNRVKHVEHTMVTVYKKSEDGKIMGGATGEIAPTADRESVEKMIATLLKQAELVKNPVYELNSPSEAKATIKNKGNNVSLICGDFIDAMKHVSETPTEDINSYEIFVNGDTTRYMNSNGIDITTSAPSSFIEVVVNARKDDHEIELYRSYKSGTCDRKYLLSDIEKTLAYGKDRLVAEPTPDLKKAAVLFSTKDAVEIYSFFADQCSAALKYRGISKVEVGKDFIEDVKGDKVSVRTVKELENSSNNADFDREGALVRDVELISGNVVKNILGTRQYSQYLGLENSFIPGNFVAEGGTRTDEELRSGSVLEIVEFSDFQVDPMSGDLAGEIRLGYWHDGNQVKIVSGGSISGNMKELAKDMYLSKNQAQYNNYKIPSLTRIEGVQITGISE